MLSARPAHGRGQLAGSGQEVAPDAQPVGAVRACQVQQRSSDLAPDGQRLGNAGERDGVARPAGGKPGEPRREGRVHETGVDEDLLHVRSRDRAEADADAARANRRQEPLVVRGGQDQDCVRGRLLQRLEERRLGVFGHAVGARDNRNPRAALDGQERQVADQVTHAALVAAADRDHQARAGGREPVEVRMIAVRERATRTAFATGPHGAVLGTTQQPGRDIVGQGPLADTGRAGEEDGVRHPARQHRRDGVNRRGLPAGSEPVSGHDRSRAPPQSAASAFLRVDRRFGVAAAAASPSAAAEAVVSGVPAAVVVARVRLAVVRRGRRARTPSPEPSRA